MASGPLTDDEKARIRDHLGFENTTTHSNYVFVYVNPYLDQLVDESKLKVVRHHLARCDEIYAKIKGSLTKVELDEVKGIKFNKNSELRLWRLHRTWARKLMIALDLQRMNHPLKSNGNVPIV